MLENRLFNKLTKSRRSLVIDHHGVTRDINTENFRNYSVNIEDTGGISEELISLPIKF